MKWVVEMLSLCYILNKWSIWKIQLKFILCNCLEFFGMDAEIEILLIKVNFTFTELESDLISFKVIPSVWKWFNYIAHALTNIFIILKSMISYNLRFEWSLIITSNAVQRKMKLLKMEMAASTYHGYFVDWNDIMLKVFGKGKHCCGF